MNGRAYYNEIDPYCAQWERNLIAAGEIEDGYVDERSIECVRPVDLTGYRRCHFFAGIAGWPLALRIVGIGDSVVWTGSPPCQDNSVAAAVHGRRRGLDGSRSGLAYVWLDLVEQCLPDSILFENVPGVLPWLHHITERLGRLGYTISKSQLSSSDIGADHPRKRVWIAANRGGARLEIARKSDACPSIADPRSTPPGDYWVETERGFRPLDDGFSERVAQVRAFGNAIDPWAAAAFIRAYLE